jgi:hypothetical protein
LLALLLYNYQTSTQKENERKLKENHEDEKLLYLYNLISGGIEFTESFIQGLQLAASKTKGEPSKVEIFRTRPWNDIIRITQNINQEEHFHAHFKRIGNFKIRAVFKNLDYIDLARIEIERNVNDHIKHEFELRTQLSSALNKVIDEVKRLLFNESDPGIDKEFFDSLHLKFRSIQKIEVNNVHEIQATILNPLTKHIFETNSRLQRLLLDLVEDANRLSDLIIAKKLEIGTEMENVSYQAERCLADINLNFQDLVKYLETIKFDKSN